MARRRQDTRRKALRKVRIHELAERACGLDRPISGVIQVESSFNAKVGKKLHARAISKGSRNIRQPIRTI
jgi:hypothetical protein